MPLIVIELFEIEVPSTCDEPDTIPPGKLAKSANVICEEPETTPSPVSLSNFISEPLTPPFQ